MSRVGLEAAGSCSRLPTSTPEGGLPATTASFEATDALKHPPRQTRRCRRRFRTTTTGQAGTPSVGSTRASRPGLARPRLLFTCGVSPRTLVARAEPYRRLPGPKPLTGGAACLVKGGRGRLELPRTPFGPPCRCRHLGPRERRERCVSPTSATDSLPEHQRTVRFPVHVRAAKRLATCRDARATHRGRSPREEVGCLLSLTE